MRRVTFITHDATQSGAPVVLLTLMRWLKSNTDLQLSTLAVKPGPLLEDFAQLGPVRRLDAWVRVDWAKLLTTRSKKGAAPSGLHEAADRLLKRAMTAAFRRLRCDLLYANSLESGLGLRAIRDHQPLISHIHEGEDYLLAERYRTAVDEVVAKADRVIAASAGVRHLLVDSLGVPSETVTVCQPFIDPRVTGNAGDGAETRSELGISRDAFVVGMCGGVGWRKGPDVFVAVAQQVLKRTAGRDVVFLWVGGDRRAPAYRYVTKDVERMGRAAAIRFITHQRDALRFMRAFDVLFLSSRADVYPLVCLEAGLVAQTPIVCFEKGSDVTDLAGDGGGFVVPFLDIDAAAASILTLMHDDGMRRRMGRRVSDLVRCRNDVAVVAPRIHALIEHLV